MKLIVAIKLRIKLEIDGTVHVLSLKWFVSINFSDEMNP